MTLRHALTICTASLALVLAGAEPAAADPAKPTDYRSTVDRIDPAVEGVTVDVIGGDGFLEVNVDAGHDVVVEGYEGEPWLHIGPGGIVEQNIHSAATYLNEDRYARVSEPGIVDPEAEPEWEAIDDDAQHVWHDHRIHWMSPDRPPNAEPGATIYDDWTVPMIVDGQDVTVHGTLVWEHDENPLPWASVSVIALGAVIVVAKRRSMLVAAIATTAAAALAVVIGVGERSATPGDAGGTTSVVVIPLIAVVAGASAIALRRRPVAVLGLLAGVAALAGWSLLRLGVLTNPVLPTDLPADLDRAGTAIAIGIALASAFIAVESGALRPIEDDETPA